jgi:glycosyltransferase involved in cell wall biosynthesis
MKKISLVFPVYNVAAYVRDSLLSALEQSYSNIEYLIIDDRGTDNSMDIVNSHSRKEAIRIIKHPKNRGLGGTRNTAILEATGEYLFFLDSDDILLNNAIELLVDLLKEDDYDMIAASLRG